MRLPHCAFAQMLKRWDAACIPQQSPWGEYETAFTTYTGMSACLPTVHALLQTEIVIALPVCLAELAADAVSCRLAAAADASLL